MNKKTALSKPGKEKRRNSDKRKEKSRDAARSRRTRETEIFTDLAAALPLSTAAVGLLDKASIMRLAISYLRVRQLMSEVSALAVKSPKIESPKTDSSNDQLFLRALQGFLLVVSADGDFVYLSENIQDYIGIPQMELMGHSIYEYSHPCDHDEIKEILSVKSPRVPSLPCSFFIRLKSTITSQGRSVNLKSASYKVIHCTGHVLGGPDGKCKKESDAADINGQHCLVAIGEPIPHPSNIEIPLDKQTFLSKHSLDMKFTYADDNIGQFLGYHSKDLLGKSVYEYYHASDSSAVEKDFKSLFAKGQCETGRYRFLAKNGGFVWVLTQATLIYGSKGQKPQSVVCVNFVISGIEHCDEIYSCMQLTAASGCEQPGIEPAAVSPAPVSPPFYSRPTVVTAKTFAPAPPALPALEPARRPQAVTAKLFSQAPISSAADSYPHSVTAKLFHSAPPAAAAPAQWHRPQAATAKIFAPRTEDMSKGFLMFADDDTGRITMLKDEPDDLTHLAPTAGDVCVPLEGNPFMADMFDDFILGDNYCPLMADEMIALSHSPVSDKGGSDPFFSYRDDSSSMLGSPQLLAVSHKTLAPSSDECSLPSLCSHESSALMSLSVDTDGDEELSMRAPYIPMCEGDDLPVLMSADLMWGPLPPSDAVDVKAGGGAAAKNNSSLEKLLRDKSPPILPVASPPPIKPKDLIDPSEVLDQIYIKNCDMEAADWPPSLLSDPLPSDTRLAQRVSPSTLKRSLAEPPDPGAVPSPTKRCREEPPRECSQLLRHLIQAKPPPPHRAKPPLPTPPLTAAHSDSVLMNLLVSGCDGGMLRLGVKRPMSPYSERRESMMRLGVKRPMSPDSERGECVMRSGVKRPLSPDSQRRESMRKRCASLLDPSIASVLSLLDLSQRDYDVNAPLGSRRHLLQGQDLLTALEASPNALLE